MGERDTNREGLFLSYGNLRNHLNELKIPVGIIITGIEEIYAEKLIILRLSHSPGHPTPKAGERDARPTFGGEVGLRMESTNGRMDQFRMGCKLTVQRLNELRGIQSFVMSIGR